MKFESEFNIGDKVWICGNNNLPYRVTVGRIAIQHTDSPGMPFEEMFDNYKAQKSHIEKYMCIETGIGSGTIYELNKSIFKSYTECLEAIQARGE